LLGGGQLAITIDPTRGERYQGIVPLGEDSLAHSLESYFKQSEQLGTRLWLAAGGRGAAGMLLQQLPAQLVQEPEQRQQEWDHVCALASTVKNEELLTLAAPEIVHRLYHEDAIRLFEPLSAEFKCSCSRERTLNALSSLPASDILELLEELGSITMDCEFCNQQYQFWREDLNPVLGPDPDSTLH
jgi:molecular chaperone Hsp33